MRPLFATFLAATFATATLASEETANVRLADGFDCPVGHDGAKRYYKARGFRPNGHLGEDWNGAGGGDTDLGDPVYCTAHGIVVFARDFRMGWGNVVIVRHAYLENSETHFVDSLYGHLQSFTVSEGQTVTRGQRIGSIGNNRGMYDAHLHFEIRKNLGIGYNQRGFAKDLSNYFLPTPFILAHRTLTGGGRTVPVPIGTFGTEATTPHPTNPQASPSPTPKLEKPSPEPKFRVNRYDDSP